jgi:lactosylceramide 4-alpha-galactosyltransferase
LQGSENLRNIGIPEFDTCRKQHVTGEEVHRDYRRLIVDVADPHEVSVVDIVNAHLSQKQCSINFFMVWSTVASSFSPRDFRSVESVFKHHPLACVVVFSSTLDGQVFGSLTNLEYSVIIVPLDVHHLLLGTKAEQWLVGLHRWREQRNFHSNISNAVRKAALLRWGGVYIDFDVIVLKPITVRNALAWMDTDLWLNGGVMVFDAGHKFLEICLAGVNVL